MSCRFSNQNKKAKQPPANKTGSQLLNRTRLHLSTPAELPPKSVGTQLSADEVRLVIFDPVSLNHNL